MSVTLLPRIVYSVARHYEITIPSRPVHYIGLTITTHGPLSRVPIERTIRKRNNRSSPCNCRYRKYVTYNSRALRALPKSRKRPPFRNQVLLWPGVSRHRRHCLCLGRGYVVPVRTALCAQCPTARRLIRCPIFRGSRTWPPGPAKTVQYCFIEVGYIGSNGYILKLASSSITVN